MDKNWKMRFMSFALSISLGGNIVVPSLQVFAEQTQTELIDETNKESKVVESATSSGNTEGNVLDTSTASACSGGIQLSGVDAEVFESVKTGLNLISTDNPLDGLGSHENIKRELTCAQSNGFHTEVSGDSAIQDTHWTVWFKNSKDDEIDKTQDTGNYHGFASNKVDAWLPYADSLKTINDGNVPEARHYEYPTDTEGSEPLEFWTDIPGYYDVLGDPRYSGIQIDSYQHFAWNVEVTTTTVRYEVNQEETAKLLGATEGAEGAGALSTGTGGGGLSVSTPKMPTSSKNQNSANKNDEPEATSDAPNWWDGVLDFISDHPYLTGVLAIAAGAGLLYAGAAVAGYSGIVATLGAPALKGLGAGLSAFGAFEIAAGASAQTNPEISAETTQNRPNGLNVMGQLGHSITDEMQGETEYDKAQKVNQERIETNAAANSYLAGRAETPKSTNLVQIGNMIMNENITEVVEQEPGSTTVHVASANVGDNAYATEIAAYKKLVLTPGKNGDIPYSVEDSPFWGSVKPSYWKDGGIYTVHNDSSLPYHFEVETESSSQDTNTINVYANIVKTADKFFTTINGYADITQVPGINKRGTYPKGQPKACIEVDNKETCSSDKSPLVRVKLDLSDPDAQKQVEAEKFVHLTEYYDPDEEEGEISIGDGDIVDKDLSSDEE